MHNFETWACLGSGLGDMSLPPETDFHRRDWSKLRHGRLLVALWAHLE